MPRDETSPDYRLEGIERGVEVDEEGWARSVLYELRDVLREDPRQYLFVYAIQVGAEGPVKFGISGDPLDRLRSLQGGNPERLYLRAVFRANAAIERAIHRLLQDDAMAGEWFRPSRQVLAVVDLLDSFRQTLPGWDRYDWFEAVGAGGADK